MGEGYRLMSQLDRTFQGKKLVADPVEPNLGWENKTAVLNKDEYIFYVDGKETARIPSRDMLSKKEQREANAPKETNT